MTNIALISIAIAAIVLAVGMITGVGFAPGIVAGCIGVIMHVATVLIPEEVRGPLGVVHKPAPGWAAPVGVTMLAACLAGWVYALLWAAGAL